MNTTAVVLADRVTRIEAKWEKVTRGPWRADKGSWVYSAGVRMEDSHIARGQYGKDSWDFYGGEVICESICHNDAVAIADAKEDMPWLLAEVRRLRALLTEAGLPSWGANPCD